MHGEGEHAELSLRIARDEPALFIHPRLKEVGERYDLIRLALHEQSRDRERIYTNIQHGAARKRAIPKAALHVLIVVKTTEVDLRKTESAKLSGARTTHELDIEGHVKDRRCVHKHNVMLIGNSTRLDQLIRIKGDRLFAKHVLSSRKRPA